ncbi:hypothetical protein HDV57DRAFT_183858 [Trichoderma longibrachiatum]
MTQSIGFGHDGGTLLQGGTSSTRSSSKAGMEWKWKGVGIRWKGMKRGVRRRRRKQKRERERERERNGSVSSRKTWACQSWIREGAGHVPITQATGGYSRQGFQGTSGPCKVQVAPSISEHSAWGKGYRVCTWSWCQAGTGCFRRHDWHAPRQRARLGGRLIERARCNTNSSVAFVREKTGNGDEREQ